MIDKTFFILALGRSGTKFLATLLNRAKFSGDLLVQHEPWEYDHNMPSLSYYGGDSTVISGMLDQRFKEIFNNLGSIKCYGEVNSYLRYNTDWLVERYNPDLIHLVRDGREFVRSAFIRNVYTPQQFGLPIVPKDSDPYSGLWEEMNRFQKLCWLWKHSNEYLNENIIGSPVRFESIISDYGYFKTRILEPLNLELPYHIWEVEKSIPRNTSMTYLIKSNLKNLIFRQKRMYLKDSIGKWSDWSNEMKDDFKKICGEMMMIMGYER